ncbi:unnamed protein product [Schistosoma guineensis]|nr:unnamed protein product [Schistosoma guineensis]
MKNGYPNRFIDKNMKRSSNKESGCSVLMKNLHINLEFKSDRTSGVIRNCLTTEINRTFYAAKMKITFAGRNLFSVCGKDSPSGRPHVHLPVLWSKVHLP